MNNEKIAKFKQIKLFIPFIIVAIAFIGVGIYLECTKIYITRNWNSVQGEKDYVYVKTSYSQYRIITTEKVYDVYVKYSVNGKDYYEFAYREGFPYRSSGIIHREVTVYYNPNNPAQIKVFRVENVNIILAGFGIVLLILNIKGMHIKIKMQNYSDLNNSINISKKVERKISIIKIISAFIVFYAFIFMLESLLNM